MGVRRNSLSIATGRQISIGNDVAFYSGIHINSSVGGTIEIWDNCLIGPNMVIRTAGLRFSEIGSLINTQSHLIGNFNLIKMFEKGEVLLL